MAVATGSVIALLLFLVTAVLLIKGSAAGSQVEPHLQILGIYLPGYSVTWAGAGLGAGYGLLLGALAGAVVAGMWNVTHYLYMTAMVIRASWLRMMVD